MIWQPDWARGLVAADVDETALYLATEAGGWPELPAPGRRAFALVVLASLEARAEGSTRIALDAIGARIDRLGAVAADREEAAQLVAALPGPAALAPFVGRPGDYRPFILDDGHLYHERDHRLELRLAAGLAARLRGPVVALPPAARAAALAAAVDPGGRRWTAAQAAAIEAALERPVTVITGGPGTGKTAIIAGIARAWQALGLQPEQIAIAAPTGKAANRIAELMPPGGPAPSTLHRLLGYADARPTTRTGVFRYHENRPLPHAAVVIDEASMIGARLMEQLLRALAPGARLVLVGDADQLPAVEAGGAFRALVPAALRLRESHRMDPADPAGAAVLEAAQAIAAGSLAARGAPVATPREIPETGFSCFDPGDGEASRGRGLRSFLDEWYARHLARPAAEPAAAGRVFRQRRDGEPGFEPDDEAAILTLLDRQRRLRLLTVTRKGRTGSARLNLTLAARIAPDDPYAPGTPVLMTLNDYGRGLFNGDQGIVVRVSAGGGGSLRKAAVFPRAGAPVAFPLASLQSGLEIAYASTVHKAQGSELDHAALVLPETDLPLLTRELVYTAVTRVRRSIVVVGQRALLDRAVTRAADPSSGLGARLAALGAIPGQG